MVSSAGNAAVLYIVPQVPGRALIILGSTFSNREVWRGPNARSLGNGGVRGPQTSGNQLQRLLRPARGQLRNLARHLCTNVLQLQSQKTTVAATATAEKKPLGFVTHGDLSPILEPPEYDFDAGALLASVKGSVPVIAPDGPAIVTTPQ